MNQSILRSAVFGLALCFFCAGSVLAQEKTVQGTVTDAQTGDTLPGANVTVQGTQTGTTTNAQGEYEIQVPGPNSTLIVSFVGYQEKQVQVGDRSVIDVSLQPDVGQLDEVVVTGYGTQERRTITGAQASVDVAEATVGQTTSPQDLLQGRVSGVSIVSNSGQPGAGMRIHVRGLKSLSASSQPLVVMDGVPISNVNITPGGAGGASNSSNPLAMINPQDIKSVQVLKGTAATSIYGSQGSNGVILIETKSGSGGQLQVDYVGKVSSGRPAKTLNLLSGNEYRSALNNVLGEDVSQDGPSTDWQKETMRSTVSQEHNLSFSGGAESTSYRASLNYLNQEGILIGSGFERLSARINATHSTLDDRLRFNLNLLSSFMDRDHAFYYQSAGFQGGVIFGMLGFDPTRRVRQNGQFVEYSRSIRNPVALLEQPTDFTDQRRTVGNLSAQFGLLENLTLKGTFGVDDGNGIRRSYLPKTSSVGGEFNGVAAQNERRVTSLTAQSTVQYNRDLFDGAHSLSFLGGFEYEQEVFQSVGIEVRDFITDAVTFNNLGSGKTVQPPYSNKERVDQIGVFGRLNYNIQDTYLLTATLRRDGSSVFGRNNKFAYFPSASVGWDVAQESFMEDIDGLTQLKFRASYGVSGNQGVPPYESLPLLTPGFEAYFGQGETEITGVAQARTAQPDLKWEETREANFGLDFTYGRFDGSVDYYRSKTTDLLLNTRVLQPSPSSFVLDNVGSVLNKGIEASLEALVINQENTSLTVSANASSNYNEILDLGGRGTIDHASVSGPGQSGVDAQRLEAGHPIGSFYGPVFTGIENGQETYLTEDGGTTTSEEQAVERHLGNPIPDVAYGFNFRFQYHGFDTSAFFRGEQGREVFNNTALIFATKSNLGRNINMLESALNDGTAKDHQPTYSSRWIQDASFLRLDKLSLGYRIPNVSQYNLRRARIYLSAQNLLVLTPYSGYDPELNTNVSGRGLGFRSLANPSRGIDYTSYPRPRTFTLGVELGF